MTPASTVGHLQDAEMGFEAVVLADQDSAPIWHLEFQCPLEPDDQDRALGMDTYCVVLPGGACAYGCLSSVLVQERSLRLVFLEVSVPTLGLQGPELIIPLDLNRQQLNELVTGLKSVLGRHHQSPEITAD